MTTAYPLYDPQMEHESCGVGAVIDLHGRATHRTVSDALTIVERLAHRAGSDATGTTGDGVGILTRLPHALFARWAAEAGASLGKAGDYAVGMFFLPDDGIAAENARHIFDSLAAAEGMRALAWRDVPCHPELLGAAARRSMPRIRQCFLARPEDAASGEAFDRRLYILRRQFEKQQTGAYVCSLSCRTIVYKGMMLVTQLRAFYDDLQSADYASSLAMVHSRFSTNTFPSWSKAHPQRLLLHNGEINTIRGNFDRMRAREETMRSPLLGEDMLRVLPVVEAGGSDSQMLDNTLEFLHMSGMPLPLAGMVLLPEPWQGQAETTPWRDLYRYYSTMMEPWDGPAAVLYSDGDVVCASLDRNGLRPLRCALTDEGRLILSSEAGALFEENARIARRWRLTSGGILVADMRTGELLEDGAVKARFAAQYPYGEWTRGILRLRDIPGPVAPAAPQGDAERARLCAAFGYAHEDIEDMILPMAVSGVGADRVHGRGRASGGALPGASAAVCLFQAALRAGDEPAHRRHPRKGQDRREHLHWRRRQPPGPCGGELPRDRTGLAHPHRRRTGAHPHSAPPGLPRARHLAALPQGGELAKRSGRAVRRLRPRLPRGCEYCHPLRPRGGWGTSGHPLAAGGVGAGTAPGAQKEAHRRLRAFGERRAARRASDGPCSLALARGR